MVGVVLLVALYATFWLPVAVWLLWLWFAPEKARKEGDPKGRRGARGIFSRMRRWKYTSIIVAWGGFGIALPLLGGILFQMKSEILSVIGIILWQNGIFSQMIISVLFTMVIGMRLSVWSGQVQGHDAGMRVQGWFWRRIIGNGLLCCSMAVIPYVVTFLFATYSLHHSPAVPPNFDPETMLQVRDLNLLLRKADATFMLLYWTRLIPLLFLVAVIVGTVVRSRLIGGTACLAATWPILSVFWISVTTEVRPGDLVVQNVSPNTHTMLLIVATAVCLAGAWGLFITGWRPRDMQLSRRWLGRRSV